jgi:hypothetical protein
MPGEPPRVQPSKKVAANWDDNGNPVKGAWRHRETPSAQAIQILALLRYSSGTLHPQTFQFTVNIPGDVEAELHHPDPTVASIQGRP